MGGAKADARSGRPRRLPNGLHQNWQQTMTRDSVASRQNIQDYYHTMVEPGYAPGYCHMTVTQNRQQAIDTRPVSQEGRTRKWEHATVVSGQVTDVCYDS